MAMIPRFRLHAATLAALLALLMAPAIAASAGNSPTPTALAPLAGDADSIAVNINNGGDAVGRSIGATTTGVVWDRHGGVTMLLPLAGDQESFGESINARGDAVGYSRSGAPPCGAGDTAVKWDRHGAATPLPPLPGDGESRAFDINNRGEVVGASLGPRRPAPDCSAPFTAVRWDRNGHPTALPSPSAALPEGFANGIQRNGSVIGFVNDAVGSVFAAVTWDRNNVPTPLPPSPGHPVTAAFGANDNGVIVGPAFTPFFTTAALVWDRKGNPPTVLPPLGADPEAYAISTNNRGLTAGVSGELLLFAIFGIFDPPATAVLWDKHGTPTPLPPLPGDAFSYAGGMNDAGAVVGFSHDPVTDTDTAVVWR